MMEKFFFEFLVHFDLVIYQQHVELLQLLYYLYANGKLIMSNKSKILLLFFALLEYQLTIERCHAVKSVLSQRTA